MSTLLMFHTLRPTALITKGSHCLVFPTYTSDSPRLLYRPDNPPTFPQASHALGVQGNMSSSYPPASAAPDEYSAPPMGQSRSIRFNKEVLIAWITAGLSNEPHQMSYPSDGSCGPVQATPRGIPNRPSASHVAVGEHRSKCCVIA